MDEVGRGTSTYDGMSLAQAILEHLIRKNKGLIFFATHYHELAALSGAFSQVKNVHMQVKQRGEHMDFLYTMVEGPSLKSYGLQVARLAGFPEDIVKRAEELLQEKEK